MHAIHSRRCRMKSLPTYVSSLIATALGAASYAQPADDIPDLSWGYIRVDLAGSGTFDGLTSEFEPAQLVDGFTPPPSRRRTVDIENIPRENGALVVTDGNCDGPSGIEPNSAGFWYVQTEDELLIVGENSPPNVRTAALRRVYLDGRPHPDPERWTPRAAGHSIGWYEDGDLIVETVGMTAGSVAAGGYKSPETKLTERFRVTSEDGMLTITYTWEDPGIYARPHSYSIHFERIPDDVYALEGWCDAGDPSYSYSVAPPAQG
jgi:hypothetical protein